MKPDIQTTTDVRRIVNAFYTGITEDDVIGPYFEDMDMKTHLPRLCAFWSSVVFQAGAYRGRPFEKHAALEKLHPTHFERWLRRFERTVDRRHAGERAEAMKARAHRIATIFQIKLNLRNPEQEPPASA